MYTIYMHKNKINNKVYIGQTIQNPKDRWKNGKGYKTCISFNNAIEKYDSTNPLKGYNITEGGSNSISPNAKSAAIEWMRQHPEFGLARAADMLRWQKEHPEECKRQREEAIKKAAEARKRKVRCIETGIVYESATEAARQVPNTQQGKICMVCRGQRKTNGGFHWEYVDEENEEN